MTTYEAKIKTFLEKETQHQIESDGTNLIEKGVLDSFSMIKLINFVETELGVKVDMEEITPGNFNSVETIARKIETWR